MTNEMIENLKLRCQELLAVPYCCDELKEATQAWLDAIGTDREKELGKALIAELEEDVMPIDATIAFFQSKDAASYFGEEEAKKSLEEALAVKEAGAVYCNCEACTAGAAILEMKDFILG